MNVQLAAFPKGFMDDLCVTRSMSLFDWIELGGELEIEGLEFYDGFLESRDRPYLEKVRKALEARKLQMPMLCCSPDFTHPDPEKRRQQIEKEKAWIDLVAFFGGKTCRVLSGQRFPEVSRSDGVRWVTECLRELVEYAEQKRVILAMENHYKDNYWHYPEFAQKLDVFVEILDGVPSPWLGVNYDPSNALLAGEDPIDILEAVKRRIVSMHASDRYLKPGHTAEELAQSASAENYPDILAHGVIGRGLNDYDRIFSILREVGFQGWISIEDGVGGMDDLRASVAFLRPKMRKYFSEEG
ncbi:MAG: sugar phosphate isomerase/epimerase family protein [Acidobacteriota bacterium]